MKMKEGGHQKIKGREGEAKVGKEEMDEGRAREGGESKVKRDHEKGKGR